jgi:dihydroorotate dehydrogenase
VIIRQRLDGIVVANTSIMADAMIFGESGGTSGRPVEAKSTEIVRFIHRETNGNLPIIGVGGVFTREDYRRKIDAGASLVQVYTGFVYEGPQIVSHILA